MYIQDTCPYRVLKWPCDGGFNLVAIEKSLGCSETGSPLPFGTPKRLSWGRSRPGHISSHGESKFQKLIFYPDGHIQTNKKLKFIRQIRSHVGQTRPSTRRLIFRKIQQAADIKKVNKGCNQLLFCSKVIHSSTTTPSGRHTNLYCSNIPNSLKTDMGSHRFSCLLSLVFLISLLVDCATQSIQASTRHSTQWRRVFLLEQLQPCCLILVLAKNSRS